MAEVYRARPFNAPRFKHFLALKRILPNLAADEEFVSMFVDEAKIAVQLNHRAVCQIYELGRLEGSFYIVMEYIAGKDVLALQNWLRKRRKIMSVAQAAFIAAEICEGLDYAHKKADDNGNPLNIIHRDISPQNVLVSYDGDVKLIDFGIARAATTNQQTQVGVLKGKFGYMSPEQVDAQPLDFRSDIFAIGTLLWEMLTARRLFYGDSDFATLEKVRSAEIQPPSARNKQVPAELDRIVLRALARDREERYQTAGELAADLREFLASASPNYGANRLSAWMVKNCPAALESERAKLPQIERFVTVDDVYDYYAEHPELSGNPANSADGPDATQVFDPKEHGSPADEVLAANLRGPTPVEGTAPKLPESGFTIKDGELEFSGDPMASLAAPRAVSSSGFPSTRRRSRAPAIVVGLLAVAIAAAAAFVLLTRDTTGTLLVQTHPSAGVQVSVDGVRQEGTPPIRVEGLEPGRRLVEVRHPDFQPILAEVDIVAGATTDLNRTLEAVVARDGHVALSLSDSAAQVYLDGGVVGGQGASRSFPVSAGESHVVEVVQPGHFVERYEVEVPEGGRFERTVSMRPVVGNITVRSDPGGEVFLDGVAHGDTTDGVVTIPELDVRQTYALEIRPSSPSFRQYTTTVVFDTYYDLQLRPRLARRGTPVNDEDVTFGYLATGAADRWYQVLVDGRDTGLVTPISESAPLALKTGDRTISFVRPGDSREVRVQVREGQTLTVQIPEG